MGWKNKILSLVIVFLFVSTMSLVFAGCGGGGGKKKGGSGGGEEEPTQTEVEPVDSDGDGVADAEDAFPADASESADTDGDGVGDNADALPTDAAETTDSDGDGIGDGADAFPNDATESADTDGDGVGDSSDNCVSTANGGQTNTDSDALGDACDTDDDDDTVADGSDNCPLVANTAQTNTDSDTLGDACDTDDDDDTVADGSDNCPLVANAGQTNTDSDTLGDACDTDDDDDTVADASDNCPLVANAGQTNTDSDALGDACDTDDDDDTVADASDNCPLVANTAQTNTDSDTLGDACDTDDDDDTVADASDNCPLVANLDQLDTPDADGTGNVCDDDDNDNGVDDPDDPDDTRMTFWVSASEGADSNAGSISSPYATLETAVTAAAAESPVRNVYAVVGSYSPASILSVSTAMSLYGGWSALTAGTRTRSIILLETIVTGPAGSPVVTFEAGVTTATLVDGFILTAADNPAGASIAVGVSNASPTLSNNSITAGTATASSTGISILASGTDVTASPIIEDNEISGGAGVTSSEGITVSAGGSGAVASPIIRDNTSIEGGEPTDPFSMSSGIMVSALAGGSVSPTIEDNDDIGGGDAGERSVGVIVTETSAAPGTSASVILRRNVISGFDGLSPPTATRGVIVGEDDLFLGTVAPIRSATIEENTILGGSGSSEAIGLDVMAKSDTDITVISNNVVTARTGTGGSVSYGIRLAGTAGRVWAVNNTVNGGNGATESISLLMDDDVGGEASAPQLLNNIFSSTSSGGATAIGVGEGCVACDPARLESNLFDTTLTTGLDGLYRNMADDGTTLDIPDISIVNSSEAGPDTSPANIVGDPAYSQTSDETATTYFRLLAGSSAFGTGQDTSAIDTDGDGVADIEVTTDIDADSRPQPVGGVFDIGADELL